MHGVAGQIVVVVSTARRFVTTLRIARRARLAYGETVRVKRTADRNGQTVAAQKQGRGYSLQIAIHRAKTHDWNRIHTLSLYSESTQPTTALFGQQSDNRDPTRKEKLVPSQGVPDGGEHLHCMATVPPFAWPGLFANRDIARAVPVTVPAPFLNLPVYGKEGPS